MGDSIYVVLLDDEITARKALCEAIREIGYDAPGHLDLRSIPFSGQWGLASSVCMQLARSKGTQDLPEGLSKKEAKKLIEARSRERAQELASEVATRLRATGCFRDVQAVNGYVNIYFDTKDIARRLLAEIHQSGESYGHNEAKADSIMVEYGQPNTHKQFHVGHLRTLLLGDSVARVLDADGYKVIRATYIGDIGAMVVKWLWGYLKWHRGEKAGDDLGKWMEDIYVEANAALKANAEYEREYREVFARWDRRDPEIVDLWKETRQWSVDYFKRIFGDLGVHFDVWFFESDFEDPGREIVRELLDSGVAEIDDGAPIVRIDEKLGLNKEQYRTLILQRSDGTSLYQTKELALTRAKFDQYHVDRVLNVVDVRQTLYFQQVFKVLDLFGYEQADKSEQLNYEIVRLTTGPMSSRLGNTVSYDEFARDMLGRAREIVAEKNPEVSDAQKEKIARAVGVGSIKFGMLDRDNSKLLIFDREEALDFDGFSAPYIQYAHARACRILEKSNGVDWNAVVPADITAVEVNLLEALGALPDTVARAAREYKPLHVVNYVYNLAKVFNEFYRESPVLRAEGDVRNFRLALVDATRQSLANGLYLLGISAPEVM